MISSWRYYAQPKMQMKKVNIPDVECYREVILQEQVKRLQQVLHKQYQKETTFSNSHIVSLSQKLDACIVELQQIKMKTQCNNPECYNMLS